MAHKLENFNKKDLDVLLEHIGDARYVLLGEASHGTSEFYMWRAEITKRLVTEKGFSFIAVEGDWPDCYRVNRYAKGRENSGSSAYEVLHAFSRWPTWMWANREIVDLIEWLRLHNKTVENQDKKVGFYGLDVYSLWESLDAVMGYLQKNYPDAMKSAIEAYRCFEPYSRDVEEYARATAFIPESCEDEVADMLIELRRKTGGGGSEDNDDRRFKADGREAHFNAEQNAVVAKNAELYYRTMMHGGAAAWNVRDHHMMNTLERLMKFHDTDAKSIVWAHNTHIGDARATDMRQAKMVNLGQLAREQAGRKNVVLVGFGTYKGSVIASKAWGEPMERMPVPPAIDGSWDSFLHSLDDNSVGPNKLLIFNEIDKVESGNPFLESKGQRAIGVVYNPSYEKYGNYVETILPVRYDAFLFIDETHALNPLHMPVSPDEELPETFPTGL
jgi:erythromycin esterase